VAVIRRSPTVAVPFKSATQMGVGTSPPAGNFIATESVVPERVPMKVPFLTLWHDAQEPSEASSGLNSTVPVTLVPDCVSTHVTSSGLYESDPVPFHMPLMFDAVADGICADGVGANEVD
jgi:hypothetical protein